MSYLSTLVGTPPAARVSRSVEPSLEQHVEIESPVVHSSPMQTAGAAPTAEEATGQKNAAPSASVEDALRAAFEWVTPRAESPAMSAAAAMPLQTRSVLLEARADPLAAPMNMAQADAPPPDPQPTSIEQYEQAIAPLALSQRSERVDVLNAPSETVELTSFESHTTLDLKAHRSVTSVAAQPTSSRALAADEPEAASQSSSIQVRIGSISLSVRTPPAPPAPPTAPTPQAATPAAERTPGSAAFAFSARRHHLRWG